MDDNNNYRLRDFFIEHKVLCVILLSIPFVAITVFLCIQFCWQCNTTKVLDWGSLLGGCLSYVGTALLGIISVWQNERLEKANAKAQAILDKANRDLLRLQEANFLSFATITHLSLSESDTCVNSTNVPLKLKKFTLELTDGAVEAGRLHLCGKLTNLSKLPITSIKILLGNKPDNSVSTNTMLLFIPLHTQIKPFKEACNFESDRENKIEIIVPMNGYFKEIYYKNEPINMNMFFTNVLGYTTESTICFKKECIQNPNNEKPPIYKIKQLSDIKVKDE